MEPIVTADRVTKTFRGVRALDDLSRTIPRGAIYGPLGPNGAGKTTLIRILATLRPCPTAGNRSSRQRVRCGNNVSEGLEPPPVSPVKRLRVFMRPL